MFGLDLSVIGLSILVALSAAAIAYVFLFKQVENENKHDQRIKNIGGGAEKRNNDITARIRETDKNKRRKSVQETIKKLEDKQKPGTKKPGLKDLIKQAGVLFAYIPVIMGMGGGCSTQAATTC